MEKKDSLTATQVSESEGLEDWRVLLRSLQSSFKHGLDGEGRRVRRPRRRRGGSGRTTIRI